MIRKFKEPKTILELGDYIIQDFLVFLYETDRKAFYELKEKVEKQTLTENIPKQVNNQIEVNA